MSCCMRASHSYARSASANRAPTSSAIAASIRFHGSVCPPGTHGMLPSSCCTDAIASIVCATSAAVKTPGTLGSLISGKAVLSELGPCRRNFFAVEHDALAEHGIQCPLRGSRPRGMLLDQRAKELVVLLHRR